MEVNILSVNCDLCTDHKDLTFFATGEIRCKKHRLKRPIKLKKARQSRLSPKRGLRSPGHCECGKKLPRMRKWCSDKCRDYDYRLRKNERRTNK